jgi:hypothetical protein
LLRVDSRNANRQPGKRTKGKVGEKGIDFGRAAGADLILSSRSH